MTAASELSFDALGTRWWLTFQEPIGDEIQQSILSEVQRFEAAYSRFRVDSDLSKLNENKHIAHVSREFRDLLQFGLDAYRDTDRVFNMSVGAVLEQSGYGMAPDAAARMSDSLREDVRIGKHIVTLAPHVRLDFGGFGKGWLIDMIGNLIRDANQPNFIINGGGDILVGRHTETLLLEHPTQPETAIGRVEIAGASLASSSLHKRTWKTKDGSLHSHIRPTTADIADNLAAVYVIAQTARVADLLGTTFLLIDRSKRQKIAKHYSAEFLEVSQDGVYWRTPGFKFDPFQ